MTELWREIQEFYRDVEAARRNRVIAIMAIVGAIVGFEWPQPPSNPETDPMSELENYVAQVAQISGYQESNQGGEG